MSLINGNAFPESLLGTAAADEIYGFAGVDYIDGDAGSDVINGGKDNDTLVGGEGADSYIFNLGDGQDTINNLQTTASADKIIFGAGITASMLKLSRDGLDLIISYSAVDSIRIRDQFGDDLYHLNTVQFSDASTLSISPSTLTNTVYSTGSAEVDLLEGYEGSDVMSGLDGADSLYGNGGNDTLDGGLGADMLDGGAGNDSLRGGLGYDSLVGGAGNDTLTAGAGGGTLQGGEGADSYLYSRGDGDVIIDNTQTLAASDKLILAAGITLADLHFSRVGDDLVIALSDSDRIVITGQFAIDAVSVLSALQFSTGSTYNINPASSGFVVTGNAERGGDSVAGFVGRDLMNGQMGNDYLSGLAGNDTLIGAQGSDSLYGGAGADSLLGGEGVDDLYGGDQNDVIIGGHGDDLLQGDEGADHYLFNLGDGHDTINNLQTELAADQLILGAGITAANIRLVRDGSDLLITLTNSPDDSIRILSQFDVGSHFQLNTVVFNDGSSLSISPTTLSNILYSDGNHENEGLMGYAGVDVMIGAGGNDFLDSLGGNDTLDGGLGADTLQGGGGNDSLIGGFGDDEIAGGDGNDVLIGGRGDDTLDGGEGNDTYLFNLGDGQDFITNDQTGTGVDKLVLGAGFSADNVQFFQDGFDLVITFNNSATDIIRVQMQVENNLGHVLPTLQFNDGSTMALPTSGAGLALYTAGTRGADSISGDGGSNILVGGAGVDLLYGNGGNDSLNGGSGSDVLQGGDGNDTLNGGSGDDLLSGEEGSDTYLFSLGDGQDTVYNYHTTSSSDKIVFGAGISAATIQLARQGNDLVITFVDSPNDSIRISDQFGGLNYQLGTLQFSDATTLSISPATLSNVIYSYATDQGGVISGYEGKDSMVGADGTDALSGNGGNDTITGGHGADILGGDAGNDLLDGGSGNDMLNGDDGNDTLTGGSGDDSLEGGEGVDLYSYALGDGIDTINNNQNIAAADKIVFAAGISAADLILCKDGNDLVIRFNNNNDDSLRILEQFNRVNNRLNTVQFNDGTTLNISPLLLTNTIFSTADADVSINALTGYAGVDVMTGNNSTDSLDGLAGNDTLSGAGGADSLSGGSGNDSLLGGTGNDLLQGDEGDDVLIGGRDDDTLLGGAGADSYLYSIGDGQDVIDNTQTVAAQDKIVLGAGLTAANIRLNREGDDLVIRFTNSTNDSIRIENQYQNAQHQLNTLQFSDGSTLSISPQTLSNIIYTTGTSVDDSFVGYDGSDVIDGGVGNDTIYGGAGDDTLKGAAGEDELHGDAGNDLLDGGLSADILLGGAGNDRYVVDNAYDVVTEVAGEGTDTVQSSISYTLGAYVENLTLTGTANLTGNGNSLANALTGNSGNNRLNGGAGGDLLNGFAGNDTLDGGLGGDQLLGGVGDDTYIVDDSTDYIIENAGEGNDTVLSSVDYGLRDNVENLTLTGTASISSYGNTLNNLLIGNAASNFLNGKEGADTLIGGLGDDHYTVDNIGDVVIENAGEGNDGVSATVSYTLSANVENLTLTGTANINGTGNDLGNVIYGNNGNNSLSGGVGNDVLNGGAGIDTMIGGTGDDFYTVDSSSDVIVENVGEGYETVYSSVSYTLSANVERLDLTSGDNLNLTGNSLNNVINGSSGNNIINGGAGADSMSGHTGNDTYYVDNAGDVVTEATNSGTDTVISSVSVKLTANVENLTLTGTGTRNGVGNDLANYIVGNFGNNTLTGGKGSDTYNLGRTSQHDTLIESDSTVGNKDTLRFAADVHYDQLWFKRIGNDLEVDIIGTANAATVKNFFYSSANHIEVFRSGDGKVLTDTHVQNLVSAMAGMAEPAAGQTVLTAAQQTQLAPVFAANWQ